MFKAEHENPNSTWSVWVKVIFQEQKGCGQWERLWGSLHWSKWHSYGISATWKPCGAADQAPAQGKVRRAQVDMRSGEVGSGVTPVLAQWYLGDLQQAVQWAQVWLCKEGRHPWIFFKLGKDKATLQICPEQHKLCCSLLVPWMHRRPKSHARVFWGLIWIGWEFKHWPQQDREASCAEIHSSQIKTFFM